MKMTLVLVILFSALAAQASGWMTLEVLPGSVFSKSGNAHIAIMNEQKSPYSSENYQCTLKIFGDLKELSRDYDGGGSWSRFQTTKSLRFTDSYSKHEEVLIDDRSSPCLQWGEEYEEESPRKRDCLEFETQFKTVINILEMNPMNDSAKNLKLEVRCEKWMSEKVFTNLDNFFRAMYRSKGNFPLFLDLALD